MRSVLFLSIPLLLFSGINLFDNTTEGAVYYFCASKMMGAGSTGIQKQEVYYSPVRLIEKNDQKISGKVAEWKKKIEGTNFCRVNSCTSDLNHYNDFKRAQKELENFLTRYSDTSRFTIVKIDL